MKPLCIIPSYVTQDQDLAVLIECIVSLRKTEPDSCDILVVDDHSPEQNLMTPLEELKSELAFELLVKEENSGFARTVNIGLRRALSEGRDAVLVNADLEFIDKGWLERMVNQPTQDGERLASVVGGLLLYPSGLIQHGGVYFSLLHRCFEHIYKFAPGDLPEAQHARVGPVTGALQFIRHECLQEVGVYDEGFRMGWEDVDYCIRTWKSGRECVYQPMVRAYHFESMFRGRPTPKLQQWQNESWAYFIKKWGSQSFAEFVPSVV